MEPEKDDIDVQGHMEALAKTYSKTEQLKSNTVAWGGIAFIAGILALDKYKGRY